jgi:2-succinyl-5-enolpyruvyl-6-hydroxy-3-cyclohexene-1-carboxylate synthase
MLSRGKFDSVIRIGSVPTVRFWRDLDRSDVRVMHYSDLPFPGLTKGEVRPIEEMTFGQAEARPYTEFFECDRKKAAELDRILSEEPQSELAMVRALSVQIPTGARVYLGNSLPIREWDLVATRETKNFTVEANRGANGIDGQLSTFFGWCRGADNWCIVGDLTAMYDMNAPWIVPQLGPEVRFKIVIINNGGGRIFRRLPLRRLELIENVHQLHFDGWAKMWNIDITELVPDPEASGRVWQRYDELWQ